MKKEHGSRGAGGRDIINEDYKAAGRGQDSGIKEG